MTGRQERRDGEGVRLRGDHGVAAVEFALILPVLALIVCGVIDLGRLYSAWNETKNAAREGALYAQTHPNQQTSAGGGVCADPNNIEARVKQELGSTSSSSFAVTTTPSVGSCNPPAGVEPPATITVEVERSVDLITPIIGDIVGSPVAVTADVSVTVQG